MKRVLLTGADGFVASHLIRELDRETGCRMIGIGLRERPSAEAADLDYRILDITDFEAVGGMVEAFRPDTVFHLAAQPSVAYSWKDPWKTYEVNVIGQVNLMESLRRAGLEPSFHVACSSEEYGRLAPETIPVSEEAALEPCSHYAVSKTAQEQLGLMYFRAFGWRVIVTRSFNQAGPGQSPDFVVSSFARQIARIEAGLEEPVIRVGNLEAMRDFTDVRDTAKAYRLLLQKGTPGTAYNVCSGRAVKIKEVLEILLELSGGEVVVEKDPDRQRPSDIPVLEGDNGLVRRDTGWIPSIPLEVTLRDTLEYWRERC